MTVRRSDLKIVYKFSNFEKVNICQPIKLTTNTTLYKIQPKTLFFGKNTTFLPSCHSTNDVAAQMIQENTVFDGTVVVTDCQTAGRGQRGNTWQSVSAQNLTFSLVLHPSFMQASNQFQLNIAISLGVYDFLAGYMGDAVKVKWPNDMYVFDRKIGGILIENTLQGSRIGHSIVGIGLNINQPNFEGINATSLINETHSSNPYVLSTLLEKLLEQLEKNYLALRNGHYTQLKKRYLQHLFRYQEPHYFKVNDKLFVGIIVGVAEAGHLAIQTEDGEVCYYDLKEVSFVI
jgi:BirA family transcriptional regulator, biotin operon repressor / biotin---[acetyl-CoA-carboxylase] ligase